MCFIWIHFDVQLSRFRSRPSDMLANIILQCKMNARQIGEHEHTIWRMKMENAGCISVRTSLRSLLWGPFANLQQNEHNKANSGQVFRHHWSVECCLFYCCYCGWWWCFRQQFITLSESVICSSCYCLYKISMIWSECQRKDYVLIIVSIRNWSKTLGYLAKLRPQILIDRSTERTIRFRSDREYTFHRLLCRCLITVINFYAL